MKMVAAAAADVTYNNIICGTQPKSSIGCQTKVFFGGTYNI